jgi:hypothetical protein
MPVVLDPKAPKSEHEFYQPLQGRLGINDAKKRSKIISIQNFDSAFQHADLMIRPQRASKRTFEDKDEDSPVK